MRKQCKSVHSITFFFFNSLYVCFSLAPCGGKTINVEVRDIKGKNKVANSKDFKYTYTATVCFTAALHNNKNVIYHGLLAVYREAASNGNNGVSTNDLFGTIKQFQDHYVQQVMSPKRQKGQKCEFPHTDQRSHV